MVAVEKAAPVEEPSVQAKAEPEPVFIDEVCTAPVQNRTFTQELSLENLYYNNLFNNIVFLG